MRILHVGDDHAGLRPCGLTLYSGALMRAQVDPGGHEVSYFHSGRCYPFGRRPRIKRWDLAGVRMIELINAPGENHWELGTRDPLLDLSQPACETAFASALEEAFPEIVHIHELARLPSSLIEQAQARGVPVVMTLHDFKPLCASVRLLDADGERCLRHEVGADCARNCAGAPAGRRHLVGLTLRHEQHRVRVLRHLPAPPPRPSQPAPGTTPAAEYQRRRDVNVERLSRCDLLIAPSARVAEIYTTLGVDPARIRVQRLTLPHLERLRPHRGAEVSAPLTFVALGAGASPSKGSRLLVEAVEMLERQNLNYRLILLGHVEDAAARRLRAIRSVELPGSYSPEDLEHALEVGDLGLMISTWEEAHGFVGIEMLAKGLPLIGNALGGITEYVQEGKTGWLNQEASAAGLARLMIQAIADPDGVRRMRQSVRDHHHEIAQPMDRHLQEVEALYDEVLAARATIASPTARRSGE